MRLRRQDFEMEPIRSVSDGVQAPGHDIAPPVAKTRTIPPMAIVFPHDDLDTSRTLDRQLDDAAGRLLELINENPAIRVELTAFGAQPNTSSAGWQLSDKRVRRVMEGLVARGIPAAILHGKLETAAEPEVTSHARIHVLIRTAPRRVAAPVRKGGE